MCIQISKNTFNCENINTNWYYCVMMFHFVHFFTYFLNENYGKIISVHILCRYF